MKHTFRILIVVIGLLILFNIAYAPEFPKVLEQYYNNPDARYGPAVGFCRTDADCEKYNYDKNSCLAMWASYMDSTIHYDERLKDWRVIHRVEKGHPLYNYIPGRWYSDYMYTEKWRYKCIDGKCYLDTERSKTERVFCEYGCDLWLQHCLCMPRDLYEFRCSDDFSKIEGLTLRWTCEKQWIVWTDCSQYGARCGEDPRHPGYLACVKETGFLVPTQGSQYATLYPIHGGKPITVAVNTATTTASRTVTRTPNRTFRRRTIPSYRTSSRRTVTGYSILGTGTISRKPTIGSWSTWNSSSVRTLSNSRTISYRIHSRTYKPRTINYRTTRIRTSRTFMPGTSSSIYSRRRIYTRKWTYRRTYYPWAGSSAGYVRRFS